MLNNQQKRFEFDESLKTHPAGERLRYRIRDVTNRNVETFMRRKGEGSFGFREGAEFVST